MKSVLLVEDDRDLAEMLAEMLEGSYEVWLAFDGQYGLELLATRYFDVVVADLVMPTLDGAKMIEEMHARGLEVPIIISSGTPELARRTERLAVEEVLAKPYEITELIDAIERVTDGHGGGSGASNKSNSWGGSSGFDGSRSDGQGMHH